MNTDDFVERIATLLDESASRAGLPAEPGIAAQPGEAASLTEELRSAAAWAGPPPHLRELILTRARSLTEPEPAAAVVPRQSQREGWLSGLRIRWRRLAWAIPATAVAAAVFTVGVVAVDRALQPGEPPAEVYAIAGSQLAPQATGQIRVSDMPSGFAFVIDVKQLPAAAPGSYYAAWLRGPEGTIPLGSFHMRGVGAPVRLWSGVSPDRYPNLFVTLQAEGDPLTPSQLVVFTAALD